MDELAYVPATELAARVGLAIRVDDTRRPDLKIGAGRVLAQDPAQGSTARRQRSIHVWLSAGQHATTVPSLFNATVWPWPAAMAVTLDKPAGTLV